MAAQALKEANERKSSGFGEASKVIQCPKEFGSSSGSVEDQSQWSDFSFSFKQWLFLADSAFEPDLQFVEEHPNVAVVFHENPVGLASKERRKKLYSVLAGVLKNRPLKVLRQTMHQNGLETWRQLHSLYAPKTKGRAMALLTALVSFPNFQKDRTCLEQIQAMERLAEEYRRASGHEVSDDVLLSTLLRVLPKPVQQHIHLQMDEGTTFSQIKDKVLSYEKVTHAWSKERLLMDIGAAPLGSVTSYNIIGGGTAPMEINQIKGKGKKGKSPYGKAKGKGKPVFPKGSGKGKSFDKGKGKGGSGIPVHYKNNSLCTRSSISMVTQVAPEDALPAVRAVQLGIVLRSLAAGWNRLAPQMFAIRTTVPKYVDTTTAPADELMWLRTTLVCREGGTWEVIEFCEAIGELPGLQRRWHMGGDRVL
eukprot:s1685_g23.t1